MAFEDRGLDIIKKKLKDGPCLTSVLGELLNEEDRPGEKLLSALNAAGIKTKRKGSGPQCYAYLDEQEEKLHEIFGQSQPAQYQYRNAVLLAFTKHLSEDKNIGLTLQPKVEYKIVSATQQMPEHTFLIEKKYRHECAELSQMTTEEWSELEELIGQWCAEQGVEKERLMWREKKNPHKMSNQCDMATLMRNFLDAQPEDIRQRVNFPGMLVEQLLTLAK